MEILAPKYGLSSRIKLTQISENHIGIVKLIKSRIIKKDAEKLIEIATIIRNKEPELKVSLICHDNICSKSIKLLNENSIEIIFEN